MSKDKYSINEKELKRVEKKERDLENEKKRIKSKCCHQNNKGKLTIRSINDSSDFKCKQCGEVFNMRPVLQSDIQQAAKVFINVINQARCFANRDDDAEVLTFLGTMNYNILEIDKAYRKITEAYGKNRKGGKKDRDRDGDSIGSYGSVDFSNGVKKKKR